MNKFGNRNHIVDIYKIAHGIYPEAELIYNDIGNDSPDGITTQQTLADIETITQAGIPVTVGMQGHQRITMYKQSLVSHVPTQEELASVVSLYLKAGAKSVVITEYDYNLHELPQSTRYNTQASDTYNYMLSAFDAGVRDITFWGALDDSTNWLSKSEHINDADAGLYHSLKPKLAYYAFLRAIMNMKK